MLLTHHPLLARVLSSQNNMCARPSTKQRCLLTRKIRRGRARQNQMCCPLCVSPKRKKGPPVCTSSPLLSLIVFFGTRPTSVLGSTDVHTASLVCRSNRNISWVILYTILTAHSRRQNVYPDVDVACGSADVFGDLVPSKCPLFRHKLYHQHSLAT